MIDGKYRYCVERVFSVANHGADMLRARAERVAGLSSRIYAVHATHSSRERIVALLREATDLQAIVRVTPPRVDSAEILDVQPDRAPEPRHSRRRLQAIHQGLATPERTTA